MKILVISDTHNNQKFLRKVFSNECDYDRIFHLGDNYYDLDKNGDFTMNKEITRVPGIYHPGYLSGKIPSIHRLELQEWKILLLHDLTDLKDEKLEQDIILYGHTHKSEFYKKNNISWINPGHLKSNLDKGEKPSYLIMKLDKNWIELQFKTLSGDIFRKETIVK